MRTVRIALAAPLLILVSCSVPDEPTASVGAPPASTGTTDAGSRRPLPEESQPSPTRTPSRPATTDTTSGLNVGGGTVDNVDGGADVDSGPSIETDGGGSPPTPTSNAPGCAIITVLDPEGFPLPKATFGYSCGTSNTYCYGGTQTDANGVAEVCNIKAGQQGIFVDHGLGSTSVQVFVDANLSPTATAKIAPVFEPTAAVVATDIPSGSINADRSELTLNVTVAVSASWDAFPCRTNGNGGACLADSIFVTSCAADETGASKRCIDGDGADVSYTPLGATLLPAPLPTTERAPYSALLVLDQGRRVIESDQFAIRQYAARRFLSRARTGDELAFGGFAGSDTIPDLPLLLPQTPLWIPTFTPPPLLDPPAVRAQWVATVTPHVGGGSPLYDALDAAMDSIALAVPSSRRRALVVLTGGDDDVASTPEERRARWASLNQKRALTGVEIVLVAGRVERDSPQRSSLRDLASGGFATLVTMFQSKPFGNEWGTYDDHYSSLDLAASLLDGTAKTYQLSFRLKASSPMGFRSGARLHGDLGLVDGCAPGWWDCHRTKPFGAIIP
jgi:hypothetical protein